MKRDWDVIREVLLEVEALTEKEKYDKGYCIGRDSPPEQQPKIEHALLLWKSDFLEAVDVSSFDGPGIMAPALTWRGHELLDTIRSRPVWEKIKSTAKEKGIELSFDAVVALGKAALTAIIGGGGASG